MLSNPQFLELCHELWKSGLSYAIQPGTRIGRGFADVGAEEYSVINAKKAVSLLTGTVIELDEFFLNYYFWVPTVDEMTKELFQRGYDIKESAFIDQRTWNVQVSSSQGEMYTAEARTLLDTFASLIKDILKSKKK